MIYESTKHMQNSRLTSALRAQPQRPKRCAVGFRAKKSRHVKTCTAGYHLAASHVFNIYRYIHIYPNKSPDADKNWVWMSQFEQSVSWAVQANDNYCLDTTSELDPRFVGVCRMGRLISSQWIWRSRLMLRYAMQSSHHICSSVAIEHFAWIGLCQSLSSCTYRAKHAVACVPTRCGDWVYVQAGWLWVSRRKALLEKMSNFDIRIHLSYVQRLVHALVRVLVQSPCDSLACHCVEKNPSEQSWSYLVCCNCSCLGTFCLKYMSGSRKCNLHPWSLRVRSCGLGKSQDKPNSLKISLLRLQSFPWQCRPGVPRAGAQLI